VHLDLHGIVANIGFLKRLMSSIAAVITRIVKDGRRMALLME
jgi:hypothetical protein